MATVKEIISMCKAGQIQEAYDTAIADKEANPTNVWTQREVGWALYYLIKTDADSSNYDSLLKHLNELKTLDLLTANEDNTIFESVLFSVGKYIKNNVPDCEI